MTLFDKYFVNSRTAVHAEGRLAKAALAALVLYLGVVFLLQASFMLDSDYLHEELRPLYWYHQVSDPSLFAGDYMTSFVSALPQPYLYEWGTRAWLQIGGDLQTLHRLLPLACWLAFLAAAAVAAKQVGDRVTQIAVLGLLIAQPIYLYQITSAVPHAFAFPLLAWAFVALLLRSAVGLAAATLLSGLLYPAAAPLVGMLLAWQILVSNRILSSGNRERMSGLLLLAAIGGLSLWLVLDSLGGTTAFGAAMEPMQNAEAYPENGPEGRHFFGVRVPLMYVLAKVFLQFRDLFGGGKLSLLLVYGIFAIYGLFVLSGYRDARRAIALFILCSAVLCLLVLAFKPFYLYRFILYPALIVLPLLLAVGMQQMFRRLGGPARWTAAAGIFLVLLAVLSLDSVNHKKLGYWWHLEPQEHQVLEFVSAQPSETMFAAWPDPGAAFEFIPYLTRRPLFVMFKMHTPSFTDYVLQMRARMNALIDAYLATDASALQRLYCEWRVDYLIVDKGHFAEDGQPLKYFAPFGARIDEIRARYRGEAFLLHHPHAAAVALETEKYTVLRLRAFAAVHQHAGATDCRASEASHRSD